MNRSCDHRQLELLPSEKPRLRCRHCHLTIAEEEIGDGHCPECFETEGVRRYDFDEVASGDDHPARYRCEACGVIIESQG